MSRSVIKRMLGNVRQCNKDEKVPQYLISSIHNYQPDSKGIISMSLFLTDSNGIENIRNRFMLLVQDSAKKIHHILPGWIIRIYLDPRLNSLIPELIQSGCEVYEMAYPSVNFSGSLWRFLPLTEGKPFISHDADMTVNTNTFFINGLKDEVPKWLKSDLPFFKRDLGVINLFIKVSAGMFGGKMIIPDIHQKLARYCPTTFGSDEAFLAKELYSDMKKHGYYRSVNPFEIIIFGIIFCIVIMVTMWGVSKLCI